MSSLVTPSSGTANLYMLSPMQQGMLFHSLYEESGGVYVTQLSYPLRLTDVSAYARAWQQLLDRQPVMRTAIALQDVEQPMQFAQASVEVPIEQLDWSDLNTQQQQESLDAYLAKDRQRGFVLTEAPLMRLMLARVKDDLYHQVWSFHHLLLDGWSLPLVMKEVFTHYAGTLRGEALPLLPVKPYANYIAWLGRQDLSKAKTYWREQLAGFDSPTSLSAIVRQIPGAKTGHAGREGTLNEKATTALNAFARKNHLTINTVVQGAWAIVLSRLSGSEDVVFGSTVSGRPHDLPGVETMLGLFINTLPVRARLTPDEPLAAWLKQLQLQMLDLRDYEYSPLVEIQSWSDVPRGMPLFGSTVTFENYPSAVGKKRRGDEVHQVRSFEHNSFPLSVLIAPEDRLWMRIEYEQSLVTSEAVDRLLGYLCTVLEGMALHPKQLLRDVPILSEDQRHRVVVEWNQTVFTPEPARCLHDRVEAQVARSPDALALTCEAESISYSEMNARANRLAHHLRHLGVVPGKFVALCVERSMDQVVGELAILKSGAAFVPMDPGNPPPRLAMILEDSDACVLITQTPLLERFPSSVRERLGGDTTDGVASEDPSEAAVLHVLCLDDQPASPSTESAENPAALAKPTDVAYMIYTSGSTGRPKGVMITHANATSLFDSSQGHFALGETDVWTLFHSAAFDVSIWETWGALQYGGRLVIVPYWVSRSPTDLRELLVGEKVTMLSQTPSAFRGLIDADAEASPDRRLSLRWVLLGGEVLNFASLRPWFERHSDDKPRIANMYGTTETTVHSGFRRVTEADLDLAPASMVGNALPDWQIYLLDQLRQPVPIGAVGEIYIGGAGVAKGYWKNPLLTAERYTRNPFVEGGGLMFRSGDLGRHHPDGDIEYLGRMDQQVQIRGFRVEPGEIEVLLASHARVRQAFVMVREDEPGEQQLVAYIVGEGDVATHAGELREYARESLPDYMVPAAFVLLDMLPLTANGKIDRRSLPPPGADGFAAASEAAFVAPETKVEIKLAELWSGLLRAEKVSAADNFFDLGGHSILATRLVSKVRTTFDVELRLRSIFEKPGLSEMAKGIEALQGAGDVPGGPDLVRVSRAGRRRKRTLSGGDRKQNTQGKQ